MKINDEIVQVSLWKAAVPRRLAREARPQVEAGGRGVWVSLRLSRCGRGAGSGGHLQGVQGTRMERGTEGRGRQAPWLAPVTE